MNVNRDDQNGPICPKTPRAGQAETSPRPTRIKRKRCKQQDAILDLNRKGLPSEDSRGWQDDHDWKNCTIPELICMSLFFKEREQDQLLLVEEGEIEASPSNLADMERWERLADEVDRELKTRLPKESLAYWLRMTAHFETQRRLAREKKWDVLHTMYGWYSRRELEITKQKLLQDQADAFKKIKLKSVSNTPPYELFEAFGPGSPVRLGHIYHDHDSDDWIAYPFAAISGRHVKTKSIPHSPCPERSTQEEAIHDLIEAHVPKAVAKAIEERIDRRTAVDEHGSNYGLENTGTVVVAGIRWTYDFYMRPAP